MESDKRELPFLTTEATKKTSALDATVRVLEEAVQPMTCPEM